MVNSPEKLNEVHSWAGLPLFLCYVCFPLGQYISVLFEIEYWRNWIDILWFTIIVMSIFSKRPINKLLSSNYIGYILGGAFILVVIFIGALQDYDTLLTSLLEIKPVFYVFTAFAIVERYGLPSEKLFVKYGVCLSCILIGECFFGTIINQGLYRPLGSGEVNYDAALVLLSLVFALTGSKSQKKSIPILILGLLVSFSRTSLVAACLIIVFCNDIKMRWRLFVVVNCFAFALISFYMRDLELGNLESMDRYWMWSTAIDYIWNNPVSTSINIYPGNAIRIDEIPEQLKWLWTSQQNQMGVEGLYPFNFHAFWLRIALAWGWIPMLLVLFYPLRNLFYSSSNRLSVLFFWIICLVLGSTMGLIYLSNLGVAYILGYKRLIKMNI